MESRPRPPILDMTPEGEFRDTSASRPPISRLDYALARVGGIALLVALAAGGLVLAALAVLFVSIALPVLIVAGAIGAGSLWWRVRRARRNGQPTPAAFVILRR